jgi:hypothetical protein
MQTAERLGRLTDWLERQPAWLRAPLYGSLFIVVLMGRKGAALSVPILVIVILFTSQHPAHDIAAGAGILGGAMIGGGLAGLAYSLAGRWLRPMPVIGPYVAGVVTAAPYMAVLTLIVRMTHGRAMFAPIEGVDLFAFGFTSVLAGVVLGQAIFTEEGLQ